MKNIPFGKAVLCILYSLFLCQVANAEPDQSNGVLSGDTCNSVTGLYQVIGEYLPIPSRYAKAPIDWALFLRETGGKRTGVELIWNGSDGILAVRNVGENLFPPENVSYSIKASCLDGKITYEIDHEGRSEGGTKNKVHMKARLFKDGDGNLILNAQSHIENTDLLIFKRTREIEINARFYPLKEPKGSASQ